MMQSKNPYSGEILSEHDQWSTSEVQKAIKKADDVYKEWKNVSLDDRAELMRKVAAELRERQSHYAGTISREMGKPITQAMAEVEKCAWVCEYYADKAAGFLASEIVETDAHHSYIRYEPLGVILAVMPWNYPFWQVFRFAAPALMAGNAAVLKHASNVMECGKEIEQAFIRAGFPEGIFRNLVIKSSQVADVIADSHVKAVTLTGSTAAGAAVGKKAGSEIKKTVLELGGSNALVIFEDADLEAAAETAVQARFQNTGQSCIAGKRLLVQEDVLEQFASIFESKVAALKSGDPMEEDTYIGVQAREDLAEELEQQVEESVRLGAKILLGGKRDGAYYSPTVLTGVTPEMPVFSQETFGPAIGITSFKTDEEAVALANNSEFGLGVSIFTSNLKKAEQLVPQFEDGAVFVNELVKSDPRLPFGGTKGSGYGRELSYQGIREFVNIKTVYIKNSDETT